MTRPARVIIDHSALHHNINRAKEQAPNSRVMAVVKANAYGHGILRVSQSIEPIVDGFAVAALEEAQQLRTAGIQKKILLLEGPFDANELVACQQMDLDIVIHQTHQIEFIENAKLELPVSVWLKVDTGMHRLGFRPDEVAAVSHRLNKCANVSPGLRYMTHFACSEELDNPMTGDQISLFNQTCSHIKGEKSLANSGAILGWPNSHGEWIRPGIMLYGASPMLDDDNSGLKAVMGFYSELITIKQLYKGEPVGYGAHWHCPEDMLVGIVAAGYGDGYPRHIDDDTPILVNGQQTRILSTPAMDMITVDLRGIDAQIGSKVELWGPNLPANIIAQQANTIAYELFCGIQQRVRIEEHGQG